MKRIDYTGQVFGRLTVLSRRDVPNGGESSARNRTMALLLCRCECGRTKEFRYSNLQNKSTTSCGCFQKELLSVRSKKDRIMVASNAKFSYYKRNASYRNIEFKLTREEFCEMAKKDCHFCGASPFIINGIDRFYNAPIYSVDTCVPCCKRCNQAKNDMSPQDFEEWIIRTYRNLFGDE